MTTMRRGVAGCGSRSSRRLLSAAAVAVLPMMRATRLPVLVCIVVVPVGRRTAILLYECIEGGAGVKQLLVGEAGSAGPEGNDMDPEVARIVLGSITAVGAVAWLVGLQFLLASPRRRRAGPQEVPAEGSLVGEGREGWLSGSAEVEGEASALASRAAAALAKGNLFTFGPVKILEKADDHIRFERVGEGVANQPAGQWFRRGELRFTPLRAGRTLVEWAVEPADLRWLLWLGGLFQAAGLLALVIGCWAIGTYVASSPDPTVRWQTFQMVQAVHFLWPPFLCGALYRRGEGGSGAVRGPGATTSPTTTAKGGQQRREGEE